MKDSKKTRKIVRAKLRKTLSNSKLRSRPRALKEQIALYAEDHSLAKTAEWLKTKNIEVSKSALSAFLTQHRMQRQFERTATVLKPVLICMKKQDPSLTPESIREAGQRIFNNMAIENQDAGAWNILQQLELRWDKLKLSRERFRQSMKKEKGGAKSGRQNAKAAGIRRETLEQIERELKLM